MQDRESLLKIVPPLLNWYDGGRRILPWREDPSPYHVWVSEIMLQQTRVEAVKPYYDRFINALPDISSLALIHEDQLLKLWEGLGYYNRVRNMQKAAQIIIEQHDGRMPAVYEQLLKLPGIGDYTAGAVASIAYGEAVPAVDGNVLRVIARLREDDRDITGQSLKKEIRELIKNVIPTDRPGDFNQALMELGALICIPNGQPKCESCPLHESCLAHQNGTETAYPVKARKRPRSIEYKTVLVIGHDSRTALRKRANQGLLAGMYEFPSFDGLLTAQEVSEKLTAMNIPVITIRSLPASKHIFTHKEWHMTGYAVRLDELAADSRQYELGQDWIFAEIIKIQEHFPIPAAYRVYLEYLRK